MKPLGSFLCLPMLVLVLTLPAFGDVPAIGPYYPLSFWPVNCKFPYPSDFPALPNNNVATNGGAGDATGPLSIRYFDLAAGKMIQYDFQEYTYGCNDNVMISSSSVFRAKKRFVAIRLPMSGAYDWRQETGFTETLTTIRPPSGSDNGYQGVPIGCYIDRLDHTDNNYLSVIVNGLVVGGYTPVASRRLEDRTTLVSAARMFVDFISDVTKKPNQSNPAALRVDEIMKVKFTTTDEEWTLKRTYIDFENEDISVPDANFWPNSGGTGSEQLSPFIFIKLPRLTHYFLDILLVPGPAYYKSEAFTSPPWSAEPY